VSTLEIRDLRVSVEESPGVHREILRGVDLTVGEGETHALMGPNGSGKSTLAYAIAGHPKYLITKGSVTLDGEDVLAMTVDSRARAGLFLAMQYPVEVPGVTVSNFLRTAVTAVRGEAPKLRDFVKELRAAMSALSMDPAFAALLALGVERGAQKGHRRDAGNLERILECEEQTRRGALVRLHGEKVATVKQHFARGRLIVFLTGQHVSECRLARAVRAHDGVNLARIDRKIETFENFFAVDLDVQVLDFQ